MEKMFADDAQRSEFLTNMILFSLCLLVVAGLWFMFGNPLNAGFEVLLFNIMVTVMIANLFAGTSLFFHDRLLDSMKRLCRIAALIVAVLIIIIVKQEYGMGVSAWASIGGIIGIIAAPYWTEKLVLPLSNKIREKTCTSTRDTEDV